MRVDAAHCDVMVLTEKDDMSSEAASSKAGRSHGTEVSSNVIMVQVSAQVYS